ncbi:MAG: tetratricopeptide repeat protein [Spirochaetaceae bacterium]
MAHIIPFPGNSRRSTSAGARGSRYPGLFMKDLGLSDDQVSALLSDAPEDRRTIFEVAPDLGSDALDMAPVLRQTVALLESVKNREPMRATAKGNLPTAVVKELFAGAFADAEPEFVRVNREDHSMVLTRVRALAQKAGLLAKQKGAFSLTNIARTALDAGNVNEIYRRLLEAHLRHPQALDRFDRMEDWGLLARALPLLLFAAWDSTAEYLYEEDFADLIVSVQAPPHGYAPDLDHLVAIRFFERFGVHFGLFVEGPQFEPPVEVEQPIYSPFKRWRRTPLFDRVFRRHVDAPRLAVQTGEMAAATVMYEIHENAYSIDGSEDTIIQSRCLRAIERCPTDADAYVVWARLYEHRPEDVLRIVEAGISATAERTPIVPPGASPWGDHTFRDVLRLHFQRAEALESLGKTNEAFEEWERLLSLDPHDAVGARYRYLPSLILADRHEEADRLLDRFAADRSAGWLWNGVLTAYARGDRESAQTTLVEAMEANPHVPELLFSRMLPEVYSYYSEGSIEEAVIYVEWSARAWRRQRGAKAWLARHTG